MNPCRVEFNSAAAKELGKLDAGIRRRILAGITGLEQGPRPLGCKKLVGESYAWRIRIGDYRVLYDIFDDVLVVTVIRVAHRRESCR